MSKIVTAINAMISSPELITNSVQGAADSEKFFVYDKKHLWSIIKNEERDEYYLHYYPGNQDIEILAGIPEEYWNQAEIKSVGYSSKVLGTKEALDSLRELDSIVSEKVYGMDDVLDEIINKLQF